MPKRKLLIPLILFLISINLALPQNLFADGMVVPPLYRQVEETAQKAVLWHDGVTETLILSITFKGDAEDFGWIIPVPAKPEVSKASDELFTSLEELTVPKVQRYPAPLGVGGYLDAPEKSSVQIIETKKVDIYDVTVLRSGSSYALASWFSNNDYPYPKNASYILNDYIDNNWYFVVAKISTQAQGYTTERQLREGHATPLKIVFNSDKIIYPLKISSITADYVPEPLPTPPPKLYEPQEPSQGESSPSVKSLTTEDKIPLTIPEKPSYYPPPITGDYVKIMLYVFADNKLTVPGYNTDYASFVKPEVIKNLAYDEYQQPWISPTKKMFLTKLVATKKPSEMTTDLILRDAEDNRPVNAPYALDISTWRFVAIILIPLTAELLIIIYFILKRRKK